MQRSCTRTLVAAVACVAASASSHALADRDNTVRWETVIGIMQAGNVVAGVTGGGQPWSALGGNARVNLKSGRIDFEVRGLVLAGGNTIGTPGAVAQVMGTLVCDTNGSAGATVLVDTPLVALSEDSDAAVEAREPDMAFLVRIAAGRWIANGAVLR